MSDKGFATLMLVIGMVVLIAWIAVARGNAVDEARAKCTANQHVVQVSDTSGWWEFVCVGGAP